MARRKEYWAYIYIVGLATLNNLLPDLASSVPNVFPIMTLYFCIYILTVVALLT
jgi:hypothetical protein